MTRLSGAQKTIIVIGTVIALALLAWPPWGRSRSTYGHVSHFAGWHFVFGETDRWAYIHVQFLFIELFALALCTAVALLLTKPLPYDVPPTSSRIGFTDKESIDDLVREQLDAQAVEARKRIAERRSKSC